MYLRRSISVQEEISEIVLYLYEIFKITYSVYMYKGLHVNTRTWRLKTYSGRKKGEIFKYILWVQFGPQLNFF